MEEELRIKEIFFNVIERDETGHPVHIGVRPINLERMKVTGRIFPADEFEEARKWAVTKGVKLIIEEAGETVVALESHLPKRRQHQKIGGGAGVDIGIE